MAVPKTSAARVRRRFPRFPIRKAAQQRAEHTARKRHQASQAHEISKQAGRERPGHTIQGAKEHGIENVNHVLHRCALAAKDWEGKGAACHSNGAQEACKRQFFA